MIYTTPPEDFQPKFQVSICICEFKDKFLFLQRQKGKGQENQWGAPAGKLEAEETPEAAAKRELFEETGIDVPLSEIKFVQKMYDRYPKFDFVVNIFSTRLNEQKDVTLSPTEHQDYKWVTLEEALNMDYMEDVDVFLKSYFKSS